MTVGLGSRWLWVKVGMGDGGLLGLVRDGVGVRWFWSGCGGGGSVTL